MHVPITVEVILFFTVSKIVDITSARFNTNDASGHASVPIKNSVLESLSAGPLVLKSRCIAFIVHNGRQEHWQRHIADDHTTTAKTVRDINCLISVLKL